MKSKIVNIGTGEYELTVDDEGNEIFTRDVMLDNKEMKLVIKNGKEENYDEITNSITSILSELYIDRMIKNM